ERRGPAARIHAHAPGGGTPPRRPPPLPRRGRARDLERRGRQARGVDPRGLATPAAAPRDDRRARRGHRAPGRPVRRDPSARSASRQPDHALAGGAPGDAVADGGAHRPPREAGNRRRVVARGSPRRHPAAPGHDRSAPAGRSRSDLGGVQPRHRRPRVAAVDRSSRRQGAPPPRATLQRMVRVALGQVNTTVGDLEGNVAAMAEWASRATDLGADVACFPELAVTGYPPEDLVLRAAFVEDNLAALDDLAARTAGGCAVLVGFVDRSERGLHNAAALLRDGAVQERYHKIKLPNYGVFDERRTFVPGEAACTIRLGSSELGLSVCE